MTQTFTEIIQSNKPVLVDFYADWCGPCHVMKPILENVKQKVGGNATVIKADVDKNSATYNVTSIPTLVIFQKGQAKWRQSGVVPANQLIQELKNYNYDNRTNLYRMPCARRLLC